MTDPATRSVEMTQEDGAMLLALEMYYESIGAAHGSAIEWVRGLHSRFDAAAARPAEPERCPAAHPMPHAAPLRCTRLRDHPGEHVWDYGGDGDPVTQPQRPTLTLRSLIHDYLIARGWVFDPDLGWNPNTIDRGWYSLWDAMKTVMDAESVGAETTP